MGTQTDMKTPDTRHIQVSPGYSMYITAQQDMITVSIHQGTWPDSDGGNAEMLQENHSQKAEHARSSSHSNYGEILSNLVTAASDLSRGDLQVVNDHLERLMQSDGEGWAIAEVIKRALALWEYCNTPHRES